MKALILAAGQGRRLWPFTADRPKCLMELGPSTILGHQLDSLDAAGIEKTVVVCGFGAVHLCRHTASHPAAARIKTLYNPFHNIADNLISLWAARSEMDGAFILLNGDNVFHPDVLKLLDGIDDACCLLTKYKSSYAADDMKLCQDGDRVLRIGKHLNPADTDAESIGIIHFSAAAAQRLQALLEETVRHEGALKRYFVSGIQALIDSDFPVTGRDIGDLFWTDVDTPEDLRRVRRSSHLFLPPLPPYLQRAGGVL
jgi:L-glutamine-phosphate cytidylyltransferase